MELLCCSETMRSLGLLKDVGEYLTGTEVVYLSRLDAVLSDIFANP